MKNFWKFFIKIFAKFFCKNLINFCKNLQILQKFAVFTKTVNFCRTVRALICKICKFLQIFCKIFWKFFRKIFWKNFSENFLKFFKIAIFVAKLWGKIFKKFSNFWKFWNHRPFLMSRPFLADFWGVFWSQKSDQNVGGVWGWVRFLDFHFVKILKIAIFAKIAIFGTFLQFLGEPRKGLNR